MSETTKKRTERVPSMRGGIDRVRPYLGTAAAAAVVVLALVLSSSFQDALFSSWDSFIIVGFVVLALLLAVFVAERVLTTAWKLGRKVAGAADDLKAVRTDWKQERIDGSEELIDRARRAVAGTESDDGLRALRGQWGEFQEALVDLEDGPHNSLAADAFFRDEELLASIGWRIFRFRIVRILPGLMTGLGMLGTFAGIAMGLSEISGMESASSGTLFEQVGDVVVGLSSAFWTSILGLVFSMATTLAASGLEEKLHRRLTEFREALDRLFPRVTPEKLLDEQSGELRGIRGTAEETTAQLQVLGEDLEGRFSNALQHNLQPAMDRIGDAVESQMERAAQHSADGAKEFTAAMVQSIAGTMSASFERMGESIDGFGQRFESFGTQFAAAETAGRALAVSLERSAAAARERAEQEQRALVAQRELAERTEAMVAALARTSEALSVSATLLQEQHGQLAKMVRNADVAAEKLGALSSTLDERLSFAAGQLARATEGTQSWAIASTEAIQQFGDGLNQAVTSSLQSYDHSLASAVSSIRGALQEMDEFAEALARARNGDKR